VSVRLSLLPHHAVVAHVRVASASQVLARISSAACLLLSLCIVTPLAAQEVPAAKANDAKAAARAADDSLRGVTREDAMRGGPSPYRNPYRAAFDANETSQTDLMRAGRMPNRDGNGYDPLPAGGGRKPAARAAADAGNGVAGAGAAAGLSGTGLGSGAAPVAGAAQAGGAQAGGVAPADMAQGAARTLYRDPFGGPNAAAQQIYHSPW